MTLEKCDQAGLWKASNATLNRLNFFVGNRTMKSFWAAWFHLCSRRCILIAMWNRRWVWEGRKPEDGGRAALVQPGSAVYGVWTKAFILGGNKFHTSDWNQKPSCHVSCRLGLLLSAVQCPLSGWMVPGPGCTAGPRVGAAGWPRGIAAPSSPGNR